MSGMFLNLRFFLAIFVGLLIQGWRFYGEQSFGTKGKDYIEAFAIGFGINAGMEGLASILADTGLPG